MKHLMVALRKQENTLPAKTGWKKREEILKTSPKIY